MDINPRPTTYKGIQMRSRLEAGYAAWLDQWRFAWEYEPRAFASSDGQYLPDFRLIDVPHLTLRGADERDVYVEVKPSAWAGDMDALARRMAIIRASDLNCSIILERPGVAPLEALEGREGPVWNPVEWGYDVGPGPDYAEVLSLVVTIGRDLRAWPHGYWEGAR